MAKDKKLKLEKDSLEMIEIIKSYLENSVSTGSGARFVNFSEYHTKDDYVFTAILDYDKFKAKIIYRPMYFFRYNFVDVKFILDSNYDYSIYDIFNLFDIEDFNLYYYYNFLTKSEMEKALSNILSMIDKYSYDITKAMDSHYIDDLKKNFEQDWTKVADDSESWKEDIQTPDMWDFVHPFFTSLAGCENSQKLLKKLRKERSKGELNTIYENRLLDYMEKGNEIVDLNATDKKSFEKGFSKSDFVVKIIIVVVTAILSAILIFAVKSIVFAGAYVPRYNIPIYSLEWFGSTLILSIANYILFGKKLFVKLNGNDERSSQRYDKQQTRVYSKNKSVKIIMLVLCLLIGIVEIQIGGCDNIGFYDDYVKFSNDESFSLCKVSYDDLTIYKELGYYDDEEYFTYDNAYFLSDNNGYSYDLGEVSPDGETQEYIDNIIKKCNKEVIEIESLEDLYN
jgi:hypothetical protein